MCLLVILHQVIPEYPLIVASNRDEDPARAAEPPKAWPDGTIAPRDAHAGGTWIGINRHGVISAVTNRPGEAPAVAEVKSRGILPLEALKEPTAMLAHRRSERIPTFVFRPYHWFYGDRENAFVQEHGGPSDISVRLRPGVHILTNMHGLNQVNVSSAVEFLRPAARAAAILPRLQELLSVHDPILADDHRICKHEGIPRTVSSSILAIHASDSGGNRWLHHEGAPCGGKWKDVSV